MSKVTLAQAKDLFETLMNAELWPPLDKKFETLVTDLKVQFPTRHKTIDKLEQLATDVGQDVEEPIHGEEWREKSWDQVIRGLERLFGAKEDK